MQSARQLAPVCCGRVRHAHKFAAGPTPNLDTIKRTVYQKMQPVHFAIKNDYTVGNYVYDKHFYGLLCSPLFEGKSYKEMHELVQRELEAAGIERGRVFLHCEPPSRWNKIQHKHVRWRWNLEK
ncbi:unnamed protein product [Vitrella brassicaformis CCMP3155]|uniref:Uncharacterized protein n=1 Tax=Vitrella brassicaformis (strain CCMP3155) TaxID=1169540 RepID=A0A0G4F0P6_VITBC|nr:unnamed protein product [Vitrella brassicaformis CCMP3155]|mmetsp:Transcript_23772/g.58807  ORF Transcript_23772/g.58807 Transcript_23772/m.58807 type:complete len:124 (-) Transcript_23772:1315-1686(-)|eukprot:CEM05421.1 unnamed protein product [Vitrella brassicaformis CCMP3155]